jgi:hypothetical protein
MAVVRIIDILNLSHLQDNIRKICGENVILRVPECCTYARCHA